MGIKLLKEPKLKNPVMIAGWPGIGNIGLIAVDHLRTTISAEEFGEIEPWEFFYPRRVFIRNGELLGLEFPVNKFYFKQSEKGDILLFIGEEQPTDGGNTYAEGSKAYRMANLVLDVAQKFGCRRVYTSGAAVAPIHHTMKSRVWAVPNREELVKEVRGYQNTVLMSDIEGRGGQGHITGLNGLLLGVARKRGLEALCLMGEIPVYLHGFPFVYPKASKSVLEVFCDVLGLEPDLQSIDEFAQQQEREIETLYQKLPEEIKGQLEKLKHVTYTKQAEPSMITEEDKKKILENIDKLFKKQPPKEG
jgi:proteasome assembly chaperone (PAC2) family protein